MGFQVIDMEHNFRIEKFSDRLKEEYIEWGEYPHRVSNYLYKHPEIQYLISGNSLGRGIATTKEDLLQLKKEIDKILDGS